jgi:glutaredoxin
MTQRIYSSRNTFGGNVPPSKTCPQCERYKEAAFRDAIEFDKFRTMLKIADDRIGQERERAAKIIESAQIFHCWGDTEINGLDVQKRLAAAIRSSAGEDAQEREFWTKKEIADQIARTGSDIFHNSVFLTEDEVAALEMHLRLRLCSEDNPDETIDAKCLLKYVLAASLEADADNATLLERIRFADQEFAAECAGLRGENDRLREALKKIALCEPRGDRLNGAIVKSCTTIARAALSRTSEGK